MAERVRKLMEEMVGEIDEYRSRGLYTEPELRALLRRREKFEMRCHGRMAVRSDFLDYASFELQLHALHALRKARLGQRKRSQADAARVRRIHFILERATRKWKGDLDLWATWADICERTKSAGAARRRPRARAPPRPPARARACHPRACARARALARPRLVSRAGRCSSRSR
jgi:U3 small nucleolar RNA-associated protein 6